MILVDAHDRYMKNIKTWNSENTGYQTKVIIIPLAGITHSFVQQILVKHLLDAGHWVSGHLRYISEHIRKMFAQEASVQMGKTVIGNPI